MATSPTPPDHIGWDLTRAARLWSVRFTAEMARNGYPQYGEARGTLLQHIAPEGTRQSKITERSGLTKQAVQQHIDALVEDGVIERRPDPTDARQRIVCYTAQGQTMFQHSTKAKAKIEAEFEHTLGADAFQSLKSALKSLNA